MKPPRAHPAIAVVAVGAIGGLTLLGCAPANDSPASGSASTTTATTSSNTFTQPPIDRSAIVGTWSSDGESTETFRADGTHIATIPGSARVVGTWRLIAAREVAALPRSTPPDDKVIHVHADDTDMYYYVLSVSDREMRLSFVPRGNTLVYTRVP